MTFAMRYYCVMGACQNEPEPGCWLCSSCAERNGGDALPMLSGGILMWPVGVLGELQITPTALPR